MYKNQYQYGKTVSLLSISEKEQVQGWLTPKNLKKAYDKTCKGYVYITPALGKWKHPLDDRKEELGLIQPFVIIQCKVLDKQSFHFEVAFTDQLGKRRRLIFYGSQYYTYTKDNIHRMQLHARVPCALIMEGMWMNL